MKLRLPLLVSLGLIVTLSAQAPRPTFEVASIKKQAALIPPSGPGATAPPSLAFRSRNATVASLTQFAYGVSFFQVVGGPDWARKDLFDIDARAAGEVPPEQMRLMVRSLLEDRFKLIVRREQREMKTSVLMLARQDGRLGPDLQQCTDPDKQPEERSVRMPRGGRVSYQRCVPFATIARLAAGVLAGPVEDKTGLAGLWTYALSYATEVVSEAPPFQTALQDQLGLKVEATRGLVDVIVIDSVQQPTEN